MSRQVSSHTWLPSNLWELGSGDLLSSPSAEPGAGKVAGRPGGIQDVRWRVVAGQGAFDGFDLAKRRLAAGDWSNHSGEGEQPPEALVRYESSVCVDLFIPAIFVYGSAEECLVLDLVVLHEPVDAWASLKVVEEHPRPC